VLAASAVTASAAAAASGPIAPGGLKVARQGADQSTLAITWRPAAGAAPQFHFRWNQSPRLFRPRRYHQPPSVAPVTAPATGCGDRGRQRWWYGSQQCLPGVTSRRAGCGIAAGAGDSGTSARFGWDAPVATPGTEAASNYAVQIRSLATNQVRSAFRGPSSC
jgi:hypothetical protein